MLRRFVILALVSLFLVGVSSQPYSELGSKQPFAMAGVARSILMQPIPRPACKTSPVDAQIARMAAWIRHFNPKVDASKAHKVANEILCWARATSLDPRLVLSVVAVESAFHPHAVSPVGALGLGQLMPDTARRLGVTNPMSIGDNLKGCTKYLHQLLSIWACKRTPLSLTLASYNAGPGAVKKYHGVPPYIETQNYVRSILAYYHELGGNGL
ncbi:MAG: lytic transglycosylase domain-containing protein [Candidatus Xenobia bacterium]